MKIYTKIVIDANNEIIEEDSYDYEGPIAECGSSGGSSGTQTTQSTTEPFGEQKDALGRGYNEAAKWYYESPPLEYYPGETVAPLDPALQKGLNDTITRASTGNPLLDYAQQSATKTVTGNNLYSNPALQGFANIGYNDQFAGSPASKYLTNVAEGDYLNSNPYLDAVYNDAAKNITRNFKTAVTPRVDAAAIAANRFGSGSHSNATDRAYNELGDSLSSLANNIYYNNYNAERGAQDAAASNLQNAYQSGTNTNLAGLADLASAFGQERGLQENANNAAINLSNADYTDLDKLIEAGTTLTADQQQRLNEEINRFNFDQNKELNKLIQYNNLIAQNGSTGSVTTATQPVYSAGGKCHSKYKEDITPICDMVEDIPLYTWRYKAGEGPEGLHISPLAEDFTKLGGNGETIMYMDALGVLFTAIKELKAEINSLKRSK